MIKDTSKPKKITIDDLARMVAHGFSSMEERLDKRLDRIEDQHGRRLDNLESRTITLKNHIENGFKKKLAW